EKAVAPRAERIDVVVEVRSAELDVGVPAVADELGADDFSGPVRVAQRLVEAQRIAVNRCDPPDLERLVLLHAHADDDARLEALRTGEPHSGGADERIGDEGLAFRTERADRLLVVEARVDAVA